MVSRYLERSSRALRLVPAENVRQGVHDLTDAGTGMGGLEQWAHQVLARGGRATKLAQTSLHFAGVAPAPGRSQRGDLVALDLAIDGEDLHGLFIRLDERIHADDQLPLRVHVSLIGKRGVGDLAAEKAGLDGGDHAAGGFDAVEDRQGVVLASRA